MTKPVAIFSCVPSEVSLPAYSSEWKQLCKDIVTEFTLAELPLNVFVHRRYRDLVTKPYRGTDY